MTRPANNYVFCVGAPPTGLLVNCNMQKIVAGDAKRLKLLLPKLLYYVVFVMTGTKYRTTRTTGGATKIVFGLD